MGYIGLPVLKTGWATGPVPLQGAQPSDSGLALAGLLVVGVTGARGSSDPWWCSPLPVAGFVLGIGLGDHGGAA